MKQKFGFQFVHVSLAPLALLIFQIIDKKKGVKDKELIGLCKKDVCENPSNNRNLTPAQASNLAKYRHPYVVQVTKAYQENSEACVLVTEPLFGSLANILKDFRNISKITDELQNFSLEPLEVWVEVTLLLTMI